MNRKERRLMGEVAPKKKAFRNKSAKKNDKGNKVNEPSEEEEIAMLEGRIQDESPASGTQGRRYKWSHSLILIYFTVSSLFFFK
jgi:hypothetical protein